MSAYLLEALFGIVILFAGSELLVRAAVSLSKTAKISSQVISLIIVAYGTCLPELTVSVQAASTGSPDIAVGTIIGSNICNLLLVAGLTAAISPLSTGLYLVRRDVLAMAAGTLLFAFFCFSEEITSSNGWLLLIGMAAYSWYTCRTADERAVSTPNQDGNIAGCTWCAVAYLFVGLGLLSTGADILIDGAAAIAKQLHVSEATIGLTLVAVGTSVPEIITCIIAAKRKRTDLCLASLVGGNIFNILGAMGLSAMISPLPVSRQFLHVDVWVLIGVTVVATLLIRVRKQIGRTEGAVFVALFVAYVVYQYLPLVVKPA